MYRKMDIVIAEKGNTMEIIERMPVPIYETVCQECKSRYQYKAVEVSYMHTNCPVCGMSNWASLIPVAYDAEGGERKDDE